MSTKGAVVIKRPFSNNDKSDREVVALAHALARGYTNSNTLPEWGIERSLNPLTGNLTFYSNRGRAPARGE